MWGQRKGIKSLVKLVHAFSTKDENSKTSLMSLKTEQNENRKKKKSEE